MKGQAACDIVDEILERYREDYGIEEAKSTRGHNSIVNMADYQSVRVIAAKAQEMFSEAKQLVYANESLSTSSAITKVGNDLTSFKNGIDTKVRLTRPQLSQIAQLDRMSTQPLSCNRACNKWCR